MTLELATFAFDKRYLFCAQFSKPWHFSWWFSLSSPKKVLFLSWLNIQYESWTLLTKKLHFGASPSISDNSTYSFVIFYRKKRKGKKEKLVLITKIVEDEQVQACTVKKTNAELAFEKMREKMVSYVPIFTVYSLSYLSEIAMVGQDEQILILMLLQKFSIFLWFSSSHRWNSTKFNFFSLFS